MGDHRGLSIVLLLLLGIGLFSMVNLSYTTITGLAIGPIEPDTQGLPDGEVGGLEPIAKPYEENDTEPPKTKDKTAGGDTIPEENPHIGPANLYEYDYSTDTQTQNPEELFLQLRGEDGASEPGPLQSPFDPFNILGLLFGEKEEANKQGSGPSRENLQRLATLQGSGGTTANAGGNVVLGKGCTTGYDIDWDCDGYGVGPNVKPDADDNDPTVNTLTSVITKYGDPAKDINNLRNFFEARGYNINDFWFVDPVSGSDPSLNVNQINARKNDITKPFRSGRPLAWTNWGRHQIVQPGDAIIIRQSRMTKMIRLIDTSPEPDIQLSGAPGKQIIVTAYPGEEVEITGCSYSFGVTGSYMTYDGFNVICENSKPGYPGISLAGGTNNVLRNVETSNWKWGVKFINSPQLTNILVDRVNAYKMPLEHCYYFSSTEDEPHTNITLQNSLGWQCERHGFQVNGHAKQYYLYDNIFHTNSYGGISMINGLVDSEIINNLMFNNVRDGLIFYSYWHDQYPNGKILANERNIFENNLIWVGRYKTGMEEGSDRPAFHGAILAKDNYPDFDFNGTLPNGTTNRYPGRVYVHGSNTYANNIFVTAGRTAINSFQSRHVKASTFENNLFYMYGNSELLVTNHDTDNTHDRQYKDSAGKWHFYWKFATLQSHNNWKNIFKNNKLTDPEFTDVKLTYNDTSWLFNFYPSSATNPGINAGRWGTFTPLKDIRGLLRTGAPDIAVYEYGNISACKNGQKIPCGNGKGVCKDSERECINGKWGPCQHPSTYQTVESLCSDTLDNDCDDLVDCRDDSCNAACAGKKPILTSIDRPVITQGTTTPVLLFGSNFEDKTLTTAIVLDGTTIGKATYLSNALLSAPANALATGDYKLQAENEGGARSDNILDLKVVDSNTPILHSVSPTTVTVGVAGRFTFKGENFKNGMAPVVGNVRWSDATVVDANNAYYDYTTQAFTTPATATIAVENVNPIRRSEDKTLTITGSSEPQLSNLGPSGRLVWTTKTTTLTVDTDVNANCKYDTNQNIPYASMSNTFTTTGGRQHRQNINVDIRTKYTYYVKCENTATKTSNKNDATILFGVENIPITFNKFKGLTTNFTAIDPRNMQDIILEDLAHGGIFYPFGLSGTLSLNRPVNLDNIIFIKQAEISLDSSRLAEFNKPAWIFFKNSSYIYPHVVRDGNLCLPPTCNLIGITMQGGVTVIQFAVPGFSNYTLQENCIDQDNDTYSANPSSTCAPYEMLSCDNNASINPGKTEICGNNIDEDCDGSLDNGCACSPAGNKTACGPATNVGECSNGTQTCSATLKWGACIGAKYPSVEICDGKDNNCNGQIDEGCTNTCIDKDKDGYNVTSTGSCGPKDCNDNDKNINPGAKEVCKDNKDNNCDGKIDEGCGGGPGGGGGSGGNNKGGSKVIQINLDDGKKHEVTITKGSMIDMKVNNKIYRVEIKGTGTITWLYFINSSNGLNASTLKLYAVDLDRSGSEDIELFTTDTGTKQTLTLTKIKDSFTSGNNNNASTTKDKTNQGTKTKEKPAAGFKPSKTGFWVVLIGVLVVVIGIYLFVKDKKHMHAHKHTH